VQAETAQLKIQQIDDNKQDTIVPTVSALFKNPRFYLKIVFYLYNFKKNSYLYNFNLTKKLRKRN